jgi:murein DD-endopeptidase MepM/ murein hydrolase activator NlpD
VHLGRGLLSLGLALALSAYTVQPALATTGPYTWPFFVKHSQSQGYGCTAVSGEDVFKGYNADGVWYDCATDHPATPLFHRGIDYSMAKGTPVVASRGGTVVALVESHADHTSGCGAEPGNYVAIDHGGSPHQYSIYYHLEQNGVLVSQNQHISAGQQIALSGNSGFSCGAHLHYQLSDVYIGFGDPSDSYSPVGKWTTSTPRLPWLERFNSQTSGSGLIGSTDICYGSTTTYWVKYQDKGGRTWSNTDDSNGRSRIVLQATNSSGTAAQSSQFQAADWETSSTVGGADQSSVSVDSIATFTFGLYGNGTQSQTYSAYFNLSAHKMTAASPYWFWLDDDTYGTLRIDIFIVPHQACGL